MATLHPTRKVQALMPLYVQKFSCIGPECSDNCCTGWRVTIDKKTFIAYKQTKNPKIADKLDQHLRRIRSQGSDKNYARMEMTPSTGECPMMEDKLCSVQNTIGEDKLSNTCFSYPRYTQEVGGFNQQSLTLSCPEAARLALLSENAFEFGPSEITVRPETLNKMLPAFGFSLEKMNEIRFFSIQIMRTQALELWQRFVILGLFCESLTGDTKNKNTKNIEQLMASIQEILAMGQSNALFDSMKPHYDIQAVTFALLWHLKNENVQSQSPYQRMIHKAVALGLGADPETGNVNESTLIEKYSEGVCLLPKALEKAPYFLENYVLNEMFRECFPFSGNSPMTNYLKLVTRFGLVRFMLAAQCKADSELPDLQVLSQTVQVFCRRYQHDDKFAVNVNECFSQSGWNSLDKINKFLKT
ncbi:flagellin lysine-N-methylase [Limnohabitans sp. 2KL-3]|uniref:flagellin lysine-N-methylase n=1 Tax=Limnohabitans sp. 2KL-3 TaxID=1100700 RepID=UPI000AA12321|nr:flagellin lysine-N-methylase [Limnohabitans sp. 2KL-3]